MKRGVLRPEKGSGASGYAAHRAGRCSPVVPSGGRRADFLLAKNAPVPGQASSPPVNVKGRTERPFRREFNVGLLRICAVLQYPWYWGRYGPSDAPATGATAMNISRPQLPLKIGALIETWRALWPMTREETGWIQGFCGDLASMGYSGPQRLVPVGAAVSHALGALTAVVGIGDGGDVSEPLATGGALESGFVAGGARDWRRTVYDCFSSAALPALGVWDPAPGASAHVAFPGSSTRRIAGLSGSERICPSASPHRPRSERLLGAYERGPHSLPPESPALFRSTADSPMSSIYEISNEIMAPMTMRPLVSDPLQIWSATLGLLVHYYRWLQLNPSLRRSNLRPPLALFDFNSVTAFRPPFTSTILFDLNQTPDSSLILESWALA
ncbi:hypothetical protein B0H15DRAFT_805753 [Mycena belliarum]|uniref:Uncharacterized protein n=1 Tax=Mycena belliarum TaxID=1033014 RepID=A0AAD6TRP2_9AGAR|nr:hypothetical protein B0H15DRAFT_805753 [Mycena belliae]